MFEGQRSRSPGTKNGPFLFGGYLGTAEWICDKFTMKTCLVPRSEEFEYQGEFQWPVCGLCLEKHLCSAVGWHFEFPVWVTERAPRFQPVKTRYSFPRASVSCDLVQLQVTAELMD